MAYYRVEDRVAVPPPEPPLAADADAHAKAAHKKARDIEVKRVEKRNADLKHAVDEFYSVVIDERTGHEVCVCEGPSHAHYIAGLLNDRPPR